MLCGIRFSVRAASIAAAVGGVTVTWAPAGRAQPVPEIDLRWSAPARCPSAANVRERIRHLLGAAAESRLERIVADVEVVETGSRYRLTLNLLANGAPLGRPRLFDSESCDSLAGAAAVTVAMLVRSDARESSASSSTVGGLGPRKSVEPNSASSSTSASSSGSVSSSTFTAPAPTVATSRTAQGAPSVAQERTSGTSSPTQPAPLKADAASARTVPEAVTAAAPSGQQEPSWQPLLHAPLLGLDAGVLPSWSYGLGAGLGIRNGRFDVVLDGRISLPQSATLGDYASRFDRRSVSVTGCYEWRSGPIGLAPCLSLSVDDVTARGDGPYVTSSADSVAWVSAGVAARARWSLGTHMALFVSPGLVVAVARPTFIVDGFGQVYQVPSLAFATSFGCEWIL